jgi:hypothetical protein
MVCVMKVLASILVELSSKALHSLLYTNTNISSCLVALRVQDNCACSS